MRPFPTMSIQITNQVVCQQPCLLLYYKWKTINKTFKPMLTVEVSRCINSDTVSSLLSEEMAG